MRHFYGTENVIWAGFGPIGNTEKKWVDYNDFGQLLTIGDYFSLSISQAEGCLSFSPRPFSVCQ